MALLPPPLGAASPSSYLPSWLLCEASRSALPPPSGRQEPAAPTTSPIPGEPPAAPSACTNGRTCAVRAFSGVRPLPESEPMLVLSRLLAPLAGLALPLRLLALLAGRASLGDVRCRTAAGGGCRVGMFTLALGVGGGLGPSMFAIASVVPRSFSRFWMNLWSTA